MNTGQQQHRSPRLSIISAFRYFLKGNMLFAFNGVIIVAIDSIACIFPSLFQQVYTDSIITHKNPEWFTPLIALYILLFVVELTAGLDHLLRIAPQESGKDQHHHFGQLPVDGT